MKKNKYKIFAIIMLIIELLSIFGNFKASFANIKEGDNIILKGDHECDSLLEYWMKDHKRWSYKIVWYVYYNDPETNEKYPAFCIEPQKEGVGTGYNSYSTSISRENDNRIWRILDRGYMGSNYRDWNLECDDDFYSANKVALHSLAEGIAPKDKYILGNRSVDGNTVEEIQRRGAKVLEVAQTLYEYGINGTETYVSPSININKSGNAKIQDIEGTSYYIQNYLISSNKSLKSYNISIENFPNGTKILNSKNEEINSSSEKSIKIAIPTNQIKEDIDGTIKVENALVKTNPIYYCKSSIDKAQSYITYTNGYEVAYANIKMQVKANNCNLQIKKVDKETNKPIANVTFQIKNEEDKEIGQLTTDNNGIAKLSNINPQTIKIKEIKVPEPYILAKEEKEVALEWGKTAEVSFENERKKGNLKITKVDADNNEIKLENVEFELFDSKGNLVKKLTTNKKGEAYVENLEIGIYTLKETKSKEGYNLIDDRKVEIKWNETKIEKIQNTKQKGQIEVYKVDKENKKQRLEGVIFEVLDENKKRLETIITNKEGYAVTSKLPIGNYYIKEIRTNNKYILNKELIKVKVKNEQITTINVENEKIKGQIEILKISENDNLINGDKKGAPIENVEFEIRKENGEFIEKIITNKEGIALSSKLEKGTYIIKETKSHQDYEITNEEFKIQITEHEKIEKITITNIPKTPEKPKLPRTGF